MLFAIIVAVVAFIVVACSAYLIIRDRRRRSLESHRRESSAVEAPQQQGEIAREVGGEPAATVPSFRDRISKARATLGNYLGSVFTRGTINDQTFQDLQSALIRADVGVTSSAEIIAAVRQQADEQGLAETTELLELVKAEIISRLDGFDRSLNLDLGSDNEEPGSGEPSSSEQSSATRSSGQRSTAVWLFVGVNGVGKTTTIGKLAQRQSLAGRSVVLAAGDTFRAAAVEQLSVWSQRSGVEIVRGSEGADPSSVVFDAIQHAAARSVPLVMADTAGRLQTKTNLMEELRKVRRVADQGPGKVTETLLIIDATTGQNGLSQAREFAQAVDVTGVILTKLDGSAKGGIVVAIHSELGVPVKLVGLGEGIADLVDFDPVEFVDALFG